MAYCEDCLEYNESSNLCRACSEARKREPDEIYCIGCGGSNIDPDSDYCKTCEFENREYARDTGFYYEQDDYYEPPDSDLWDDFRYG